MSSLMSRLTLGFAVCSKSAQNADLHLPQELLDLIVDELHADVRSLRACALTGRPLLHRARAHLFRELVLTPVSAQRASPSPHLYPYVQRLRLIGLGNRGTDQWSAQSRTLDIVSQMTNVREVSVINVELTLLYDLHWASTIDTLFLNILRVESRTVFFDLMKQFPNLRHFSFYQFHTLGEEDSGDGMEPAKEKIRLKMLEVCFTYSRSDVVDILIHPRSPFSLEDLATLIIKPKASDVDALSRIRDMLAVTGEALTTLDIGPFRMHSVNEDLPILDLTRLRILHIAISDRVIHQALLTWWTSVFASRREKWALEDLTITVLLHFYDWDSLTAHGSSHFFSARQKWDELAKVLCQLAMRKVYVKLELREGPERFLNEVKDVVDSAFGVLRVQGVEVVVEKQG
ncbi:hypothetical protein BDZ89DRAFT_1139206 [Hymenopellis radicata]|nr:hypothetical protein BDZ89DRAFT_1139206 [Hymenopellis radicata]